MDTVIEPTPTEPTPAEPTPAESSDWRSQVSEEFRGDDNLNNITDVSDLAKNYLSLNRMMGSRIKIPGEGASDDDRAAFNSKLTEIPGVVRLPEEGDKQGFDELYAKLGRPETVDGYTYESPDMPRGSDESKVIADWFKAQAHESGASNQFVSKILGGLDQMMLSNQEAQQKSMDLAESDLHMEWGNDHARRMGAARGVVGEFGGDEAQKAIDDSGLGNNPHFNKMMSNIGLANLEDSAINAGLQGASETPAEIQENIHEAERHPSYLNAKDPMHDSQVEKVVKLRGKLIASRVA